MTSTPYDIDNFDKYDNKFHICMKLSYNNISYFNVYGHIVPSYISLYSYKTDIYTTYYQKHMISYYIKKSIMIRYVMQLQI